METRRIESVQVKLTPEERERLGEAARLRRVSVSEFVRSCVAREIAAMRLTTEAS